MRIWLLVAVLTTLTLAGCLDDDGLDTGAVGNRLTSRASEALGTDAELLAIMGLEAAPDVAEQTQSSEECGDLPADHSLGDGKAPIWMYVFIGNGTNAQHAILTDGSGDVLCEEDGAFGPPGSVPLDAWNVDAPEAASIIADHVDSFPDDYQGGVITMTLSDSGPGPIWTFTAVNIQTGVPGTWMVDARNGSFLTGLPGMGAGGVPEPEGGTGSGSTTGTAVVSFIQPASFGIQREGHARLDMTITMDDPTGAVLGYTVRVTDPSGTETDYSIVDGETITVPNPASGTYEVRAFPASAGAWDFHVDYCAYTNTPCNGAVGAMSVAAMLGL